jgi:hypothetical protein
MLGQLIFGTRERSSKDAFTIATPSAHAGAVVISKPKAAMVRIRVFFNIQGSL